jgi:GT2 family glycosyltransferase
MRHSSEAVQSGAMTPKEAGVKSVPRSGGTRVPPPPEIAVVIPTYQREDRIPLLLSDLARQSLASQRFEVIVVDDCSTTDMVTLIERLALDLPYRVQAVRTPVNDGPAAARNLGWQVATAPFLAFLDDDCTPDPGWLEAGLAALTAEPHVGVVQGRTRAPEGVDLTRLPDWSLWRVVDESSPFFEGCNLFFRRSVLEVTGGFDEDIHFYGEDTAAGWRVLDAGWDRAFAHDAVVTHEIQPRGWRWHIRNGLTERNIVHAAAKHPGFRREGFWRPWAIRREDAAFVLALVGVTVGLRFRPALLLAMPYLWWRLPPIGHVNFLRLCFEVPAVDAARMVGHLRGAVAHRVLVI